MIRINSIIDEIKSLKNEPTYRSALQISRLLESNKTAILTKLPVSDFDFMLQNFQDLSYSNPKDHNTPSFIRDYEKYFESLLFHLNKIV